MNLTPVDLGDIPRITRPNSRTARLIGEFLDSGAPATMVTIGDSDFDRNGAQLTINTVRSGLTAHITKNNLPVVVFARSGVLFMRRTDVQ